MSGVNDMRVQDLKAAMAVLNEIQIPELLQPVALQYLLSGNEGSSNSLDKREAGKSQVAPSSRGDTADLREYIKNLKPKGAVSEIPCLMYWSQLNEGKSVFDERSIIELYRRGGLRPPKNVIQSFRDLCSKKYQRLEAVNDQPGCVRLSRTGEDFVIHDVGGRG